MALIMSGDPPGLRGQFGAGLRWSFGSSVLTRLGTLLAGIVMARLLVPTEFGEFTVALVAMTLLANINDVGIEQNLVRWPGRVAAVAPTAVTVIFGFSAIFTALAVVLSGAFASALGTPEAAPIVRFLALAILVNGAFAVPSAMLTRTFRQDLRTYAELTGFVVGTTVTIVLALAGYGAWSFAWGRLVGNTIVGMLFFILSPVRFAPGWDRQIAGELLRSSLPLGGASVVAVGLLNVDYIVVGRILGTHDLGLYTIAFNLASWPVTFFAVAVARVSVAAFATIQHDQERVQSAYERISAPLLLATALVCALISGLSQPLVRFVYGDQWAGAASALSLLAGLAFLRVLYQLWADVLVAVGSGASVLRTQLIWLIALVPALIVGSRFGLPGVGVAHLAAALLVVGPAYLFYLRGTITPLAQRRALLLTGMALVTGAVIGRIASGWGWSPFFTLALGTPLTMASYLAIVSPVLRDIGLTPKSQIEKFRVRRGGTTPESN